MSALKTVAVIGKYFEAYDGIDHNIYLARQLSRMIWNLGGFGVFTAHMNTAHFEVLTMVDESTYQEFDRLMIERAIDAAVVVPNWSKSSGTLWEIQLMNGLGRPVFEELQSLIVWARQPRQPLVTVERRHDKGDVVKMTKLDVGIPPLTIDELLNYRSSRK